jgi:hypothetical protein
MRIAAAAAGEHLAPTQAVLMRVIEYLIKDWPGSGDLFCLITTITGHELAPGGNQNPAKPDLGANTRGE